MFQSKSKDKGRPITSHEGTEGGIEVVAVLMVNLCTSWRWVVNATVWLLCTGGWVGPRASLDGCGEEKMSCFLRGSIS
jgi:hypothetical protein